MQRVNSPTVNYVAQIFKTPFGNLKVVARKEGLCRVIWTFEKAETSSHKNFHLQKFEEWLMRYCKGQNPKPLPWDIFYFEKATDFQKKVWRALADIPYRQLYSYGDVAGLIGNPKACRAVGQANHNNPLPLVIPCHRVIGANGSLGGYTPNVDIKRKLLVHEGHTQWM